MNAEIIETTIARAVTLLLACGCTFVLSKPDGEIVEHGMQASPPIIPVIKPHRKRTVHHFKTTGYIDRIKAMQVGDVEVFETAGYPFEAYRSAISSQASHQWGKGNGTSIKQGSTVQLLRLR